MMDKKAAENKKKSRDNIGLLNTAPGSYLESTRRPLYALLFLLPLLIIYEAGTLLVNTDQLARTQARVATFTWLFRLAQWLGIQPQLAWAVPGFIVVILLLCLHLSHRDPWRITPAWLLGMALESAFWTLPLFLLGSLINQADGMAAASPNGFLPDLITSIGAGIYEELIFRLILIILLLLIFEDLLKFPKSLAVILAVLISAALFSAHHYVSFAPGGIDPMASEPFDWYSFLFRAAAGIYFAFLFHYRGYGITAGAHSVYDIIYFTVI